MSVRYLRASWLTPFHHRVIAPGVLVVLSFLLVASVAVAQPNPTETRPLSLDDLDALDHLGGELLEAIDRSES